MNHTGTLLAHCSPPSQISDTAQARSLHGNAESITTGSTTGVMAIALVVSSPANKRERDTIRRQLKKFNYQNSLRSKHHISNWFPCFTVTVR